MPEPYYSTTVLLNAELGVTPALSDAQALVHIQDAEDLVDGVLDAWLPDETTGRKIVEADVDAWQWAKLTRATTKVAANLYRNPGVLTTAQYRRVKGPDFEFEDVLGGTLAAILTPNIITILNDSGLRNIAGRAHAGPRPRIRADHDRFLRATRHDGT